jgi:hypothetical protein
VISSVVESPDSRKRQESSFVVTHSPKIPFSTDMSSASQSGSTTPALRSRDKAPRTSYTLLAAPSQKSEIKTHAAHGLVKSKTNSLDGDVALLAVLGGLAEAAEDTSGDETTTTDGDEEVGGWRVSVRAPRRRESVDKVMASRNRLRLMPRCGTESPTRASLWVRRLGPKELESIRALELHVAWPPRRVTLHASPSAADKTQSAVHQELSRVEVTHDMLDRVVCTPRRHLSVYAAPIPRITLRKHRPRRRCSPNSSMILGAVSWMALWMSLYDRRSLDCQKHDRPGLMGHNGAEMGWTWRGQG